MALEKVLEKQGSRETWISKGNGLSSALETFHPPTHCLFCCRPVFISTAVPKCDLICRFAPWQSQPEISGNRLTSCQQMLLKRSKTWLLHANSWIQKLVQLLGKSVTSWMRLKQTLNLTFLSQPDPSFALPSIVLEYNNSSANECLQWTVCSHCVNWHEQVRSVLLMRLCEQQKRHVQHYVS